MPCSDQLILEVVDLGVGPLPLGLLGEALDPLDQHPAVPAAVEDGHPPGPRQMPPEPPEVVLRPFLVGRSGDRNHLIVARVEGRDDAADGAALAGGVPSLEDEDGGDAQLLRLADSAG